MGLCFCFARVEWACDGFEVNTGNETKGTLRTGQSAIRRNAAQPQPKLLQETHLQSFASAQEIVAK
jgi:hypothetical protein